MTLLTYIHPVNLDKLIFVPKRKLADNFMEVQPMENTDYLSGKPYKEIMCHESAIRDATEEEIEEYEKLRTKFYKKHES